MPEMFTMQTPDGSNNNMQVDQEQILTTPRNLSKLFNDVGTNAKANGAGTTEIDETIQLRVTLEEVSSQADTEKLSQNDSAMSISLNDEGTTSNSESNGSGISISPAKPVVSSTKLSVVPGSAAKPVASSTKLSVVPGSAKSASPVKFPAPKISVKTKIDSVSQAEAKPPKKIKK